MLSNGLSIEVTDLHKSFNGQRVLDGIDLRVTTGTSVAVLGRSGTGKSVLLKLIIGLIHPDSGSIRIESQEITNLNRAGLNQLRKRIGFLFQQTALYDSMTVEENVAFPLLWHTRDSEKERRARVHELLSRVGMQDAKSKMPAELSGGMKKRVGLARALALNPRILLLDEPTAGLDPVTAAEIHDLFRSLQDERNISSIVVTHDISTVKEVSDLVLMLHEGRTVFEGDFEDLQNSENPNVMEFMRQFVGGIYA